MAQQGFSGKLPAAVDFATMAALWVYPALIMFTMGSDLQPDCLADRLLTGLGQPQINP